MAGVLGSLVVSLGLDAAQFVGGINKAEYEAKKFTDNLKSSLTKIAGVLGVSIGATAFVGMIKSIIDADDHLNDLSKSTGIAVETLGGLGFAAKQSGTDLDGMAKAAGKLNLSIAAAAAGNEDAQQAFKVMGLSVRDAGGNIKTADVLLVEIAQKFATYADGPNKAALGNKYFGKTYQDIIPLLDDGGKKLQQNIEYFKKYGLTTDEIASKADEFNDTLVKLGLLGGAFAKTLTAELLPSLQGVAEQLVIAKEKGDGFKSFAVDIADVLKAAAVGAVYFGSAIRIASSELGFGASMISALAHADLDAYSALEARSEEVKARLKKDRDEFIAAINKPGIGSGGAYDPRLDPNPVARKKDAPGLPSKDSSDAAKKLFDQQLKVEELFIKDQQEMLSASERALSLYYEDDLIGLKDFYASRKALRDSALEETLAAYDKEIAVANSFIAKAATPADRVAGEEKLAEAIQKRGAASREAATKDIESAFEAKRALQAYADTVAELNAQILELSGNEKGAAAIRFGQQYRSTVAKAQLAGDQPTIDNVQSIGAQRFAQIDLNKAAKDYSNTITDLGIEQARITLAQQTGSITEIDALAKRGELVTAYIGKLRSEVDAYTAIANSLQAGPDKDAALLKVKQLKLEIDQLSASADELGKKFRDIFTDSFAEGITDVITGAKSIGDAFRSMEKSIIQSLANIASHKIADAILGTGTAGGDWITRLAGLFVGAVAGGASGAPATSTGGGYGEHFASGTDYAPGGRALVGERGPEVVNLPRGAQVIPNDVLRGLRAEKQGKSVTINQTVNVLPGASTKTASQAGAEILSQTQRALMRNG